jgi:hypothetical protein
VAGPAGVAAAGERAGLDRLLSDLDAAGAAAADGSPADGPDADADESRLSAERPPHHDRGV